MVNCITNTTYMEIWDKLMYFKNMIPKFES